LKRFFHDRKNFLGRHQQLIGFFRAAFFPRSALFHFFFQVSKFALNSFSSALGDDKYEAALLRWQGS